MIEIMCRDGKTSDEDLEAAADVLQNMFDDEIVIIPESERRAMVFWSDKDVVPIMKAMKVSPIDMTEDEYTKSIMENAEMDVHQAMLSAGKDVLYDAVADSVVE